MSASRTGIIRQPGSGRKLDVAPTADEQAEKALAKLTAQEKIAARQEKLLAAEKRWMRKLRLCTTKLRKNRAAQRRLNKRKESLN